MPDGCDPNACSAIQRLEAQVEKLRTENAETHRQMWGEIHQLKTNDAVQDSKYDTILNQLNTVVAEVKILQAVPGDNWKSLIKTIGTVIISALGGFIAAKLGLG